MATAVASGIAMHGVGLHSVGGRNASGVGGVVVGTKMVQQTFGWDAFESDGSVAVPTVVRDARSSRNTVRSRRSQPARTAVAPRVTVPTVSVSSSQRRGRCEHIGGVMASVLGKYGLSLDDLQRAIEELEAQQALSAV